MLPKRRTRKKQLLQRKRLRKRLQLRRRLKKKAEEEANAAKKKDEEEAAAAKKKAEEEAAAKKKAEEEAAAKRKAEEIAIANMKDPIQELFLTSIRAYSSTGGIENADPVSKSELNAELTRVAKQFGGVEGEDMTQFPTLNFTDPEVDPINVGSK